MYNKLIFKIRVASVCIMFLGVILSTLIGVAIINDLQELIGFLVILIGSCASLLLNSIITYICDILDKPHVCLF